MQPSKTPSLEIAWLVCTMVTIVCLTQTLSIAFNEPRGPDDIDEFVKWAICACGFIFGMAYFGHATEEEEDE